MNQSANGSGSTDHLFFKVNLNAIKNLDAPFIKAIGSDNFTTLCVLAAFMDEHKRCYPTLATIGRCLGISESAAGQRIKKLRECSYHGQPVIDVIKRRVDGGKFYNNRYRILTSAISIFHSDTMDSPNRDSAEHVHEAYSEEEIRRMEESLDA